MKPGYRTTEFWTSTVVTLLGPIITVAVLSGKLTPEAGEVITHSGNEIVQAVGVLIVNISSIVSVRSYMTSRTQLKVAESQGAAPTPPAPQKKSRTKKIGS